MAKHLPTSSPTSNTRISQAILIITTGILVAILALAGKLTSEILEALINVLRVTIPLLNLNQ